MNSFLLLAIFIGPLPAEPQDDRQVLAKVAAILSGQNYNKLTDRESKIADILIEQDRMTVNEKDELEIATIKPADSKLTYEKWKALGSTEWRQRIYAEERAIVEAEIEADYRRWDEMVGDGPIYEIRR